MGFLFTDKEDDDGGITGGVNTLINRLETILRSNATGAEIYKVSKEMDQVYSNLATQMGLGRESAVAIKSSLGDAYSDVAKLGGGMADIEKIQKGLVSALGTNVLATTQAFKDIYAASKVAGVEADSLSKTFIDAGYNFNNIGKETEKIVNTARSLGVSAQAVSSSVLENMSALDTHNFAGGVEGLAKMAATSAGLRVNMSSVLNAVDKAFNPEGAIEMAAAFQRLGVSQSELLDPMRLMNMSQNDPEAFQQSISKMGASLTELDEKGNVRIAPGSIRRMKELADAAGMPQGEFIKMSKAAAELDMKMSKLQFPDFATDEQKTLLANITQMKDGKMQIKVDGEMKDMNEVLQGFKGDEEGLKKFLKDNQPKSNEELLDEQLTVSKKIAANTESLKGKTGYAMAGTKKGEEMLVATGSFTKMVTDAFNKNFDIKDTRVALDKNLDAISGKLLNFVEGKGSFSEVVTEAAKIAGDGLQGLGEKVIQITKDLNISAGQMKAEGNTFEKIGVGGVEMIGGALKSAEKIKTEPKTIDTEKKTTLNPIDDKKNWDNKQQTIIDAQTINSSNAKTETFYSGKMNLDVTVTVPPNMDKATFEQLMKSPEFKESLLKMIKDSPQGNNKTKVPANR